MKSIILGALAIAVITCPAANASNTYIPQYTHVCTHGAVENNAAGLPQVVISVYVDQKQIRFPMVSFFMQGEIPGLRDSWRTRDINYVIPDLVWDKSLEETAGVTLAAVAKSISQDAPIISEKSVIIASENLICEKNPDYKQK